MIEVTRNELKVLQYITEGVTENEEQYIAAPDGLTKAQFLAAARSLSHKLMIRARFVSGGDIEGLEIQPQGQAVLDDIDDKYKCILRDVIKSYDITMDQYDNLVMARNQGYAENKCYPNNWSRYKEIVLKPLLKRNLLDVDRERTRGQQVVIDRLGLQLLEEIEDKVFDQLPLEYTYILKTDGLTKVKDPDDERVILEIGQGKNTRYQPITAASAVQAVIDSGLKDLASQSKWEELLSSITTMDKTTFHRHWN